MKFQGWFVSVNLPHPPKRTRFCALGLPLGRTRGLASWPVPGWAMEFWWSKGLCRKRWAWVTSEAIGKKEVLEMGSRKCHEGLGLGRWGVECPLLPCCAQRIWAVAKCDHYWECYSVQKVDSEHPKAPCSRDHRVRSRPKAGKGPCCTWGKGCPCASPAPAAKIPESTSMPTFTEVGVAKKQNDMIRTAWKAEKGWEPAGEWQIVAVNVIWISESSLKRGYKNWLEARERPVLVVPHSLNTALPGRTSHYVSRVGVVCAFTHSWRSEVCFNSHLIWRKASLFGKKKYMCIYIISYTQST